VVGRWMVDGLDRLVAGSIEILEKIEEKVSLV
jgi:hypothetical protein